MAELQRQQGPAKGPAQPELLEEAGSSVIVALARRDANYGMGSTATFWNRLLGANERATMRCTYQTYMIVPTSNFKGTQKEVVELHSMDLMKMETVALHKPICGNQIKFSTCTLLGNALTWWNSHVRTVAMTLLCNDLD
ncbi:hypothetical protein Tco_1092377 [Tanacetum coccineum]|uniref:Retrotransposon gag domain-containing protein n=1 Tax=Tanacetum coccineum TaxID=301880 RepID=A0ABQ5IAZ5_9ASTR